MKTENTLTWLR